MTESAERFEIIHGADADRQPIFSVLVKRSYNIGRGGRLQRLDPQPDFVRSDRYYDDGDPQWSCVQQESELVPFKPFTDVVILADAHAPGGRPTLQMPVSVSVRTRTKTLRVIGDRTCRFRAKGHPVFTEPKPFTRMEIRFDRAYGGHDSISMPQTPFSYPRNDRGCGFVLANVREKVEGLMLPNIEDPAEVLLPDSLLVGDAYRWNDMPLPEGFGWLQRGWYPRCSYAGSMPAFVHPDQVMREEALNLVPRGQVALSRQLKLPSYHPRFHNGASNGLVFDSLEGSEPMRLSGMNRDGDLSFKLPGEVPQISLDIGSGETGLQPFLHTVCVRAERAQVDLIWRGALVHPGLDWLPQMTRLHAEVR